MEFRVPGKPGFHAGMLMGAVVVDDEVEVKAWRGFLLYFLEKADEFLMAVTGQAVADHLSVEHAECRKECRRPVTPVVVCAGSQAPLLHGKPRLGPVEGLDLALLVDAEHHGLVGRVKVEADNVVKLRDEVLVPPDFEGFDEMGLQVVLLPYPPYRGLAQSLSLGHGTAAPVGGI